MTRFTAADLAARFGRVEPSDVLTGDHVLNPSHATEFEGMARREAAVLVPVIDRGANEATVLLTRRADHLRAHAGQIAFPGGGVEAGETVEEAALREAWEEVALERHHVQRVLGPLPRYASGSGFLITPVVAIIDPAHRPVLQESEVAEAFEVPLGFLMTAANHIVGMREWRGKPRRFYDMRYRDGTIERRIWGVTAGVIRVMYDRLYAEVPA